MRIEVLLCAVLFGACNLPPEEIPTHLLGAGAPSPTLPLEDDPVFVLGQALFFDRELSGNRNTSCATCHVPFGSTTEPRQLSIGEGGEGVATARTLGEGTVLSRNTSSLFIGPDTSALFWDGRVEVVDGRIVAPVPIPDGITTALEALVLVPLFDREEMRGDPGDIAVDGRPNELAEGEDALRVAEQIMARLMAIPEYQDLFRAAFPEADELQFQHLARALVHFQLALWDRDDSAFDRFERGIGPASVILDHGRNVFFGAGGCIHCHSGPHLGGESFHNIGVPQLGPGRNEDGWDEGRGAVTGLPEDRFAFRAPPLDNVRLTGPWMHNGAYATLEAAVRHHFDPEASLRDYDATQLPESLRASMRNDEAAQAEILATLDPDVRPPFGELSDFEFECLMAFLVALDGQTEILRLPDSGVPDHVPSGLPIDEWPGGGRPFR